MSKFIKPLFLVGGLYDFLIGLAFLIIPYTIFEFIDVALPSHIGYVQFSAAFLMIFGLMLFSIARDPLANKNLISYAAMIKIAYCAIVGGHYVIGNMPLPWVFFGIADFLFLLAFVWAYREIGKNVEAHGQA